MDFFEIILAFVEGLALIASPCILPILPLVLSTSLVGGKLRPLGVILGFVLAFTLLALASYQLVQFLGIDMQILRWVSLLLLTFFGCVLISDSLSEKFQTLTQSTANFSGNLTQKLPQAGFFSGLLMGCLIGLVWTPCAGPIMAAALVSVIRQESTLHSSFIIFAFTLGTAFPMLLIVLLGKALTQKMQFLARHSELVRKILGFLILLTVAFIAFQNQLLNLIPENKAQAIQTQQGLENPLKIPYLAPDFEGISTWINSKPLTMHDLLGKVVLIDFWTYSCINCVRTLPSLTKWDEKYRQKGLVIVGVHSPEFAFERDVENVQAAVKKNHILYPVALDNQLETWSNFHNQYWPAHYLINKQGQVVYVHFGEGNEDMMEHNIRELLGLGKESTMPETQKELSFEQTRETYLGYLRLENFASKEPIFLDKEQHYSFPESLPKNHWALKGMWKVAGEKSTSLSEASLRLRFYAQKVFLVMGNSQAPIEIEIYLNGKFHKKETIGEHTLYELIDQASSKEGELEIKTPPGLEIYAFTFG